MSVSSPSALVGIIKRLTAGESPDPAELTAAFNVIWAGDASPVLISALLIGLRVKGETPLDLVPTLATCLRIPPPRGCDGVVLPNLGIESRPASAPAPR